MKDEELDQLLGNASRRWRVPVNPPLDAIWSGIDEALASRPASRRIPGWWGTAVAASVALLVGVAGGRYSAHQLAAAPMMSAPVAATVAALPASNTSDHEIGELLGRTAILLAALPADSIGAPVNPEIRREGTRLLSTTRELLDTRAGSNRRLRPLLQDLELVLAQVARLQPDDRKVEVQFIQTAVYEHDLMPRLRSAAADLSLDDF